MEQAEFALWCGLKAALAQAAATYSISPRAQSYAAPSDLAASVRRVLWLQTRHLGDRFAQCGAIPSRPRTVTQDIGQSHVHQHYVKRVSAVMSTRRKCIIVYGLTTRRAFAKFAYALLEHATRYCYASLAAPQCTIARQFR